MHVFIVPVAGFMYYQVPAPIMFLNGTNDFFFLSVASGYDIGT